MSDVMFYGILTMPYEMVMNDELSRFQFYKTVQRALDKIAVLEDQVEKLLNHCPDPECWECAKIVCPYGSEMHFHHDGCPTCAEMEYKEK